MLAIISELNMFTIVFLLRCLRIETVAETNTDTNTNVCNTYVCECMCVCVVCVCLLCVLWCVCRVCVCVRVCVPCCLYAPQLRFFMAYLRNCKNSRMLATVSSFHDYNNCLACYFCKFSFFKKLYVIRFTIAIFQGLHFAIDGCILSAITTMS